MDDKPDKTKKSEISEKLTTKEIIHPTYLPGVGFQSYEKLNNNSNDIKSDFINDTFRNPTIEYYSFEDTSDLDQQIESLHNGIEQVGLVEKNNEVKDAINTTLEYRISEMTYIKMLADFDNRIKNGNFEDIYEITNKIRELNEALYGKPEIKNFDGILNQIWGNINSKKYLGKGQEIYDQLKNGFYWGTEYVSGLPQANDQNQHLPEFDSEGSLAWVGEHVESENADIQALINELWDSKIESFGDNWSCNPEEIKNLFNEIIAMRDPENKSKIKVIIDEKAKNVSWDSSKMAIIVGGNRTPIKNRDEMFRLALHEFGVHGQRAINGLKTDLPILGTGLYTDTERADYLSFEEGFATILEESVKNSDKKPEWDASRIGLYLNVALAEQGRDFREVYELSWRYRVLMRLKSDEEPDQDLIDKQKSLAYDSAIRSFRGNVIDLKEKTGMDIKPLTYNKDLAYLGGRVVALEYLKNIYATIDVSKLDRLFKAKFDPTIPKQNELVERFC